MIRKAVPTDLDRLTEIESICFPPAEAAGREALAQRLYAFPACFWVMEEAGEMIGFINGMATDEPVIADEMFENAFLHKAEGQWQSVFGLDVLPEYRGKGCAAQLMQALMAAGAVFSPARHTCCIIMKNSDIAAWVFPLHSMEVPNGMIWCWNSEPSMEEKCVELAYKAIKERTIFL